MNAMSVSPVKPPLNSGNLTVSPTATNLTKPASNPSVPTNNSYNPSNLIPEVKSAVPPINSTVVASEKSIDLCSKPTPAPISTPAPVISSSNGSISPIISKPTENSTLPVQNCVSSHDVAENLSTSAPAKAENNADEVKTNAVPVEKKEPPKSASVPGKTESTTSESKESPEKVVKSDKGSIAQNVSTNEVPVAAESVPKKEEPKKEEVIKDEVVRKATASPTKHESSSLVPEVKSVALTASTETKEVKVVGEKSEVKIETKTKLETAVATPATPAEEEIKKTPARTTKRKAKTPVEPSTEEENSDGRKSKRTRLPTQPYQSPTPELQKIMANLSTPTKTPSKAATDKITAFYKNEFLAVRNPEGSFYICQAFQNIYRGSSKIKIRWFTNLPQNIYTPDFYDTTEFDCILTNVTMTRVEKDRWKLPDHEHTRIENILKRALDVEKGVTESVSVTEEHPDGLDLSLYKDEAQLQKKSKKAASPKKEERTSPPKRKVRATRKKTKVEKPVETTPTKKSPRVSAYLSRDSVEAKATQSSGDKVVKKDKKEKKKKKTKGVRKQIAKQNDTVNSKTWEPSVKASNSSRVVLSLKKEDAATKSITSEVKTPSKRTSSVSQKASAAAASLPTSPPSKRRKEEPKPNPNQTTPTERPGKVRNAGSAVAAKISSAAMRTTKEKERKTPVTNQRKK